MDYSILEKNDSCITLAHLSDGDWFLYDCDDGAGINAPGIILNTCERDIDDESYGVRIVDVFSGIENIVPVDTRVIAVEVERLDVRKI
jgi:hypothetical protein